MKNHLFKNQKYLWTLCGILLVLILCGLFAWLGGGMAEMMKSHLGM